MGLQEPSNKIYVNVAFGKIRKKCEPSHPKAVERETQSGEKTYALEYNSLSGILSGISFKEGTEHKGKKFNNSWILFIDDQDEHFALQVNEQSRFGDSLLKRIPNMRKGEWYKIAPYQFTPQGEEKEKVGLSIKTRDDKPVDDFYHQFIPKEGGEGFTVKPLNGFPEYDGPKNDKEEFKIYLTRARKFMRGLAMGYIKSAGFETPVEDVRPPAGELEEKADDLPF